jgi:hypothetical protein
MKQIKFGSPIRKGAVFIALLFGFYARAELKLGSYEGETPDQKKCGLVIEAIQFENNIRHPFSERVSIAASVDTTTSEMGNLPSPFRISIVLSHPVSVVGQDSIQFDHDILSGFIPYTVSGMMGGGLAFILEKKDVPLANGGHMDSPSLFKIILNQRTPEREIRKMLMICDNLKPSSSSP